MAPFASFGSATASDWGIFFALGVFQMGLGLALLTVGARLLPPAEVALLSLLEVVLGPLWVWLAYAERPSDGDARRRRRRHGGDRRAGDRERGARRRCPSGRAVPAPESG